MKVFRKFMCIILSYCLLGISFSYAQEKKKADQKEETPKFDIRELALPSEVRRLGKKMGSIYYSPSVKGKVLIPVHFWGEVGNSGLHFIPVDTSLVKGLSLAGGPKSMALLDNVRVTSKQKGKLVEKEFDLSGGGDADAHDFQLSPGDTIFVERDDFQANRAYYTGLIGVIATILSSVLLYREVKK